MGDTQMSEQAKCQLCGEPMPPGEEMFNYHGYSGPCPKPPLAGLREACALAADPVDDSLSAVIRSLPNSSADTGREAIRQQAFKEGFQQRDPGWLARHDEEVRQDEAALHRDALTHARMVAADAKILLDHDRAELEALRTRESELSAKVEELRGHLKWTLSHGDFTGNEGEEAFDAAARAAGQE